MFCANCGKNLPEGARFCTQCGTPVTVPVSEPAPPRVEEKPAQPRILGKRHHRGFFVLILVALVVLLAVVVALMPKGAAQADWMFTYTDDDGNIYLCTEAKEEGGILFLEDAETPARGVLLSRNGKYLALQLEDGTLYWRDARNLRKGLPVELCDDETTELLTVQNDGSVYYLRGDGPYSLYRFDGESSQRMLSRIEDYEEADKNGEYLYYFESCDDEDAMNVLRIALKEGAEPETLAEEMHAALGDWSGQKFLMAREEDGERDLYLVEPGKKPERIVRGAGGVYCPAGNDPIASGFYYTERRIDSVWLSDAVLDETRAEDEAMTEPKIEDFTTTQDGKTVPDQKSYVLALNAYRAAQERNALRAQLRETRETVRFEDLYFWKDGKSTLIAENLANVDVLGYNGEAMLCYKASPYYAPAMPLEEVTSTQDVYEGLFDPKWGETYLIRNGVTSVMEEPVRISELGFPYFTKDKLYLSLPGEDGAQNLMCYDLTKDQISGGTVVGQAEFYFVHEEKAYYLFGEGNLNDLYVYSGGTGTLLLEDVAQMQGACTETKNLSYYAVTRNEKGKSELYYIAGGAAAKVEKDPGTVRGGMANGDLLMQDDGERLYYLSGAVLTRIERNCAGVHQAQTMGQDIITTWHWYEW